MTPQRIRRLIPYWFLLSTVTVGAEDWPAWRGPSGDGVWKVQGVPDKLPSGGPAVRWKRSIGAGYAGVSVAKGRCYTMDRPVPTDKTKTPDGAERIVCLDSTDGKPLWVHQYSAHYGDLDYGTGPRANPTVHKDHVYTLGAVGTACCLDADNGRVVWSRDLVKESKAKLPTWGFAASPLVVDDLVVFHVGAEPNGSLVALEQSTGKEKWRSIADPAGYCTPLLIDEKQGRQLVVWTPKNVRGVDPKDGAILWTIPYEVTYGVSIATPIYRDGILFVTGYWEGSKAIQLGPKINDAKLLWEDSRNLRGLMAPPLCRDGLVYTLDKQFGLTCCELKTGKKLWDDGNKMTPKGRNPQATFVWIGEGDRVAALNSDGDLILARFTPKGYIEESRANVIGPTWANPAFAEGAVFARNDSSIARIQLAEASAAVNATSQDDSRRIDGLLKEWEKQTKNAQSLRVEFEQKSFDKAANQQKIDRGVLLAVRPTQLRVEWVNPQSEQTGLAVWTTEEFRYYDYRQRSILRMVKPTGQRRRNFGQMLARTMYEIPVRYSFLWFGTSPEEIYRRFAVRIVEEDGGAVWLGLQPRDPDEKSGFEHILVGLDKVSGRPGYIAFVTSPEKQELFTVKNWKTDPTPALTAKSLLENLPKDFAPPPAQ